MKTPSKKLRKLASQHDLDETAFVMWRDNPRDDAFVLPEAAADAAQLFEDGEDSIVVGVYKLVSIERVTKAQTVTHEVLAS